jgi:hypothetical protein
MVNLNRPRHLIIGMHFGDPPAPDAEESTADMLSAITANMPLLMQTYNAQVLPQAQAELAASQAISPAQNQLMLDLYKQFAPEFAKTGAEIDSAGRLATAKTDVELLKGSGADLARVYQTIDKELNPEYYSVRENAAGRLNEILGESINAPNIEAERLINQEQARTGNAAAPSATNTVAAALDFGSARQGRINNLSNIIGQATGFMAPASNQQFNPATTILNKPTSNTGQNQFAGVKAPSNQAYSTGSDLMNSVSGFQNNAMNINANRRDVLDRANEVTSSIGSVVGGM